MKARQDSEEEIETLYELADLVNVKAVVPPSNKVCLWLGVSNIDNNELLN